VGPQWKGRGEGTWFSISHLHLSTQTGSKEEKRHSVRKKALIKPAVSTLTFKGKLIKSGRDGLGGAERERHEERFPGEFSSE